MKTNEKLWAVFQVKGDRTHDGDSHTVHEWEFQGVFDSEAKAVAACRTEAWFVMPCKLNEELPAETMVAPGYYPRGPNVDGEGKH